MNLNNLCREIRFKSGLALYTPPDPYRIYERLGKLFLKANDINNKVISNKLIPKREIYDMGNWSQLYEYSQKTDALRFIKWIYQEIPSRFWKFNVHIALNRERLQQSAKDSAKNELWIDFKGMKNKTKSAIIDRSLLSNLRSGVTYLPTYEQIAGEVSGWGDYKYQYGNIEEQKVIYK